MDQPLSCSRCGKESYLIYKELSLEKQTRIVLCHECSGEKVSQQVIAADYLANDLTCPTCHSSFVSIDQGKALGCCSCYDIFSQYITKLLLDSSTIPGKLRHFLEQDAKFQLHIGRTPFNNCSPDVTKQIEELEHLLENALKTENYELAASYRDQLSQLKLSHKSPSL